MAPRCVLQESIKLEHCQLQPKFMAERYFIHNALLVSAEQKVHNRASYKFRKHKNTNRR